MSARARGFIEAWHPRAERWELLCRIKQVLDEYVELLPLLRPILACLCSTGQRSQTPLWARLGRVLARLTRDYMGDDHVDSAYEWSESDYLLLVLDGRYAEGLSDAGDGDLGSFKQERLPNVLGREAGDQGPRPSGPLAPGRGRRASRGAGESA